MEEQKKEAKKKILIFVPEFPRLSETFIERDIAQLIKFGNLDITVFSLTKGTGAISEEVLAVTHYERLTLGVSFQAAFKYLFLHPLKMLKIHNLLLGKDKVPYLFSLRTDKNDLRTKTSVIGFLQNSRLVHFFKGVAYAKLMEKYSPDEIHVHFMSDSSNIAMVSAMVLDVPFSVSGHAKDILVEPSLARVKAKYAKFITVCNQNAHKVCVRLAGENGKNVFLNYHGHDESTVFKAPLTISKPNRPLIYLGGTRLVEKKGIKYMVEASKILKDRGISHEVLIVGGRDMRDPINRFEELTTQIKSLGVESNVKILGKGKGTPFNIVSQYYRLTDVFVFPSIDTKSGDADGISTVLIEAALAKLPIVATNSGSTAELIDSSNGIIVPQKNAYAIANAVEKLLFNKELAKDLGQKAYERAKKKFDVQVTVRELERLLLQ